MLAAHDRQRLQRRLDRERFPHPHRLVRRGGGDHLGGPLRGRGGHAPLRDRLGRLPRGWGGHAQSALAGGAGAPDPVDEGHHVPVARVKGDHEVVIADLVRAAQLGAGPVPWVLVVQHHRPPHQRFQLGHFLVGVEDVLGAEHRVVRVVIGADESQRVGLLHELGHRRLDRRQLGSHCAAWCGTRRTAARTPCSRSRRPRWAAAGEGALDRGDLPLAVRPRGHQGQEHVIAMLRQVTPAGRALVEHSDRVAVDPEQVLAQVAQQFKPPRIGTRFNPGQQFGPVGAFASKSRPITAVKWSSVSRSEKSRSPRKLAGKTSRPCRLITNDFMYYPIDVSPVTPVTGLTDSCAVNSIERRGRPWFAGRGATYTGRR